MGALLLSLLFAVPPSKEYKIDALKFDGNNSFRDRRLAGVLVSKKGDPFSEAVLKYDLDILATFYSVQGFFGTRIEHRLERDTARQRIKIHMTIDEGERPRIEKVIIAGVDDDEARQLLENAKTMEGGFLIEDRVARARMEVLGQIRDRGYPFARITTTFARDTRYVVFTVEKGLLCYVRNIKVSGLKRYKLRVVEREIKIARGEAYRVSKVVKSQRAIYGLGIFGYVDAAAEPTGVDSVDLNFIVNEISPRVFNFGFGVEAPPEWVLNSIGVLASVGFEHLNLLNLGHTWASDLTFAINLKGEYDIKFDPFYTVPHVFGSQAYFLVHPFIQYEDKEAFSRMTRGVEGKVIQFIRDYLQVNLANRYKYVHAELKAADTTGLDPALTNSVIANIIFDTRDDFFSPRRGIYVLPLIEDAGGLLGGDNHFYRLSGELRVFQPVVYGITAFRLRVGRLYPRREPVSVHEEFTLGGQGSVRGFDEKSIGPDTLAEEHYGSIMANANLEYRFDLYRNLGAVIFCDIGDVRNNITDFAWSTLAKSVGAGLRYRTPVGPIRLDYGRGFGQGAGRFSFGFYNIF